MERTRCASYPAEMSPNGNETADHAHHRATDHAKENHLAIEENGLDEVFVDDSVGDPDEEQCQETTQHTFDKSVDEEGKPDEHIGRADEPHDGYLLGPCEDRHADSCADDDDRDGRECDTQRDSRDGRDIPQA